MNDKNENGYRYYDSNEHNKNKKQPIRVILIEGKYPKNQDEAEFMKRIIRWVSRKQQ